VAGVITKRSKTKINNTFSRRCERHTSPKHQAAFLRPLQIHGLNITRICEFIMSLHAMIYKNGAAEGLLMEIIARDFVH